jgi:predicted transcriptional regulator
VVPTTIRLSKELKERIARLVAGSEQSMHAFLLEAIEQRTSEAERRREFVEAAVEAREEMSRTGKGFPADKVHAYARARAAGKKAARPRARAWPK